MCRDVGGAILAVRQRRFEAAHDVRKAQSRYSHQHRRRRASALPGLSTRRSTGPLRAPAVRRRGRRPQQRAGIGHARARCARERVSQKLEALGNARANESVDISTKISNIVTAVTFRDGERVKRGQVLVQLDDAQARADVAAAQARRHREREPVQPQSRIAEHAGAVQVELRPARKPRSRPIARGSAAARARLEDTVIRAPFSGRVGLRRVSVGTLISPGDVITTLDDTSVIKLDFSVPENFLAGLREGLVDSRARAPAFPGRSFAGKVSSIDSRVDMNTRSVTVRALLANEDGALKPGMFLNVSARQRRTRSAGHSRRGAHARSRAPVRVRGERRQGLAPRSAHRRTPARAASKCLPA